MIQKYALADALKVTRQLSVGGRHLSEFPEPDSNCLTRSPFYAGGSRFTRKKRLK